MINFNDLFKSINLINITMLFIFNIKLANLDIVKQSYQVTIIFLID